jgi:hypothetical protein
VIDTGLPNGTGTPPPVPGGGDGTDVVDVVAVDPTVVDVVDALVVPLGGDGTPTPSSPGKAMAAAANTSSTATEHEVNQKRRIESL